MPQLDSGTYISQLFWLFISFASLYLFTWKVSIPRLARIMESRRQHIESFAGKAEEIEAQAEKVRQELETVLDEARNKAHDNVMQMIHKVTVTSAQRKKDLNNMMVERIQSSEVHLNRKKEQAMDGIKTVAQEAAFLVVEKLTGKKVSEEELNDVLNELFSQKVA